MPDLKFGRFTPGSLHLDAGGLKLSVRVPGGNRKTIVRRFCKFTCICGDYIYINAYSSNYSWEYC